MTERSQIIAKKLFLQGRLDALENTIAMLEAQRERTAASIESLEEELKGGGRDGNACQFISGQGGDAENSATATAGG